MVNECRRSATSSEVAEKSRKLSCRAHWQRECRKRISVVLESFFGRSHRSRGPCRGQLCYWLLLQLSHDGLPKVPCRLSCWLQLPAAAMAERAVGTATWPPWPGTGDPCLSSFLPAI